MEFDTAFSELSGKTMVTFLISGDGISDMVKDWVISSFEIVSSLGGLSSFFKILA